MNHPDESYYHTIQAENRLILLVSPDRDFGGEIARQMIQYGFEVQIVPGLKHLSNLTTTQKRIAILVDLPSLERETPGVDVFQELEALAIPALPKIFIAENYDHLIRVKAIRAGGVAFFTKPVDIVRLIDKLDGLSDEANDSPYRILIIGEQEPVAKYYQVVLRMAGMDAIITRNPGEVLPILESFHPDLILMDLVLPQISGIELAKIIRQMDEYVHVPILFVSGEDDFNKQIEALSLGGDDFLIKPIKAAHLIALVKSRLERLRILRTYMVRDSLTGLYNHTSFLDFLYYEFNRSQRQNTNMALVMLDIDHFKLVNDTYGHMVGDTVLKTLARLLRQRLRKSDMIGRYGGEEFVILLIDSDTEMAYKVIDDIRQSFSEIRFSVAQQEPFTVTFSCGIAAYPEFSAPDLMIDAADKAMYRAKANNRNRVVVARN